MKKHIRGADKRPTLHLPFAGRQPANGFTIMPRSPSLSAHELRQVVAAMID